MNKCPRRTLLGGIGSTLAIGAAGCLSTPGDESPAGNESGTDTETETETESDTDENGADAEFGPLLEYLPASAVDGPTTLVTVDTDALAEANEPYGGPSLGSPFDIDPDAVSNAVAVETDENYATSIIVLSGDVLLESEPKSESNPRESPDGTEYDRYELDSHVAAVTDDVTVVVRSDERAEAEHETDSDVLLEAAFEAAAGDTERLLGADPVYEDALETLPDGDRRIVMTSETITTAEDDDIQPEDLEFVVYGQTVLGPDTIELRYGIRFTDAAHITDELLAEIEDDFGYGAGHDEPEITVDDTLVTVSTVIDLEAQRKAQEIESPRVRSPMEIDRDADSVELDVTRGDPTPVEDLTLELNDEVYDPDVWAAGQETIEEGDTIRIATDDLEPNLQLTLRHEHAYGGSATSTTINSHFAFEADYDLQTETLTLEYADEIPLDGDELHLAVYEERTGFDDDSLESTQPWTGQEVTDGATATLDGVLAGHTVIVGWRSDSRRDSIYSYYVQPPGYASTDYDYESKTLEVTLELEDPRPAAEYQLLVEDEPAPVQWTDDADTVDSGATVTLEDVDVGTAGTIVWGDDDVRVSGFTARPSITLDLERQSDDGDDNYTLEHLGGDQLPTSSLEVVVWSDAGRESIAFEDLEDVEDLEGTFSEGDVVSLDLDFEAEADGIRHVNLEYDDQQIGAAMFDRDED
ncbi:hypothetical protein [Natronoglomus mannanivorans]|uniref:Uncharacterized protein n=1 Tax=Natronoglomus mannanivorans TaxID=2979990 RepID=A0AAP3E2E0_9EURY|nr:hypothetical protein [Halobacteria archaeon AArc-xg1-1]